MRTRDKLTKLIKVYRESRPSVEIKDAVEIGHALKENRILRDAVERFATELREDEHLFVQRFQALTGDVVPRPSRFDPIPPQKTMTESVRLFVRQNRGMEFRAIDVSEACGFFEKKHIFTVRTFLRRLVEEQEIKRLRQGVYRSRKKKKKGVTPDNHSLPSA